MIRNIIGFLVFPLLLLSSVSLYGQTSGQTSGQEYLYPPSRPLPRYLDDYSGYDTLPNKDWYQKIKYSQPGSFGYFSFGGELRYRYEYFDNYRLGFTDQDGNGYLLDRYLLHADIHNRRFRLFAQFRFNNVYGRSQGPRSLDRDEGDINQLFLELPFRIGKAQASFCIGRREIFYGSNRWIDYREGPNARLSFDGITFVLKGRIELDVFHLYPVKIGAGAFDNLPDFDRGITGLYLGFEEWVSGNYLNIYGLHHSLGRDYLDDRLSLGVRNKFQSARTRIDFETLIQVAESQEKLLGAFSIGLDMDYRLPVDRAKMNMGFISLYTSGANGSRSMTFHPLYPTNKNLRNMDLLGKHNLFYFQPYIQFAFSDKDKLILESICYWKASLVDNVYTIPGTVLINASDFDARYLGTQLNLSYKYYLNPFLQAEIGYRAFIASEELHVQTGTRKISYFSLGLIFRF